jgi:hypothetical protein
MEMGMFKRFFLGVFLVGMIFSAAWAQGEIVVLGDTPVAEFTLPDGSVLKNAFVWRRSSEGLMIVHDDGQVFLNFSLLPDDWKAAYLGDAAVAEDEGPQEVYELYDPYKLKPILDAAPNLIPQGSDFVLRKGADAVSSQYALALGILQSLLSGDLDNAKRLILVVEEKGVEIEGVDRDSLFVECDACHGEGRVEVECKTCNGTGKCPKCEGTGERDSALGKGSVHCTACRGTGKCPDCDGVGSFSSVCRVCRGRGKLLQKQYCKVKRDYFVYQINALANPVEVGSILLSDRERVVNVLKGVPGIDREAVAYYSSEAYTGGMDSNILVACIMESLLNKNLEDAKRFLMIVETHYGDQVLAIDTYLQRCETCNGTGVIERECPDCEGSGKCPRCGGDGERDTDFRDRTIPCTTCRGTGKCVRCGGAGFLTVRCPTCEGLGRTMDKARAEVRLQLMVEELNRYYQSVRK